ncbi:hypothetical protein PC129_g7694 [Phytophthora cactorum]|uniref:Uncharacterized protein n=1 Tax=Phytophthora cactorum TaxID=29920 RepID=A0A329R9Z6_9STRA|nr:hypothetical protein GQ600_8313 [Phytophthora cactorum]KAG2780257.1 hypothetical protein Pcac1_g9914 [Phytophthora cactorum]KAG2825365.1 hypothetical protein PC112_g9725 [Phytophthora cactorum]KAG2858188.1 hypothetical protein PC113_g10020 [Phytophthora cactorum]KAG2905422.1 hypothetical protein PC114_g11533 [Phytophthora cactorum]
MSASSSSMKEDLTSSTTTEDRQASQRYKERICKELLRSRLQQIERLEANLERIAKYSIKLLDAHEEIANMLAHEKDAAIRLAAAAGASAHDVGYVMSYAVALEQCCGILLERPL